MRNVFRNQRLGAAIVIHKRHVGGAAAERFDPDRAGAGVAVEHPRAAD